MEKQGQLNGAVVRKIGFSDLVGTHA